MSLKHFLVARCFCKLPHMWLSTTMASSQRCLGLANINNIYSSHNAITTGYRYMSKQSGDANDGEGDFKQSEELLKERYDLRSNEELDKKRARLIYQSRKRGMLENGVILSSFADKYLQLFDADQLDQYDRLINLPTNDWDIFYWATRTKPTPPEYETPVMAKLREHLKSKVSNSSLSFIREKDYSNEAEQNKSSGQDFTSDKNTSENIKGPKYKVLDKTDPEAIVARPRRKAINSFDFQPKDISLVDYKEELHDEGIIALPGGRYMERMTNWRKRKIEEKLKRSLPAPISARHMDPDVKDKTIYTQRIEPRSVSYRGRVPRVPLVNSKRDRLLKHHDFMQHLLSSKFTDDAIDYEEEAKAWADMVWHRNYGQLDDKIAPSQLSCNLCSARLQCCDTGLAGYVPKELLSKFLYCSEQEQHRHASHSHETNHHNDDTNKLSDQLCQRCSFSGAYDISITSEIHRDFYIDYLQSLRSKPSSIICIVVDLTDLPGSIWPGLLDHIGSHHRILVVGNKLDVLPYDGGKMLSRVTYSLRKTLKRLKTIDRNLNLRDVVVLSARTGFGVESLVARLIEQSEVPRDIHLIGCNNSGKFTLFNALMQSDISAAREGDLLGRVSTFECPGTHMSMLRFPCQISESWEIELKKRKSERVERDHLRREHALGSVSEHRQETMPHMSMLINRLDIEPVDVKVLKPFSDSKTPVQPSETDTYQDSSLMKITSPNEEVKFTGDHPLANVKQADPFAANETNYPQHNFVYHGPSCTNEDQLHTLLTNEERLEVFPSETIVPRKYSLRPLQSIMIAGLGRLDILTSNSNVILNVFCSKYLPIHVISTSKADKFYTNFLGSPYLGIPFGDANRMAAWPGLRRSQVDYNIMGCGLTLGSADVVLSSIGWVLVNLERDHECIVRAHTPAGKGIFLRDPPLLAFANRSLGKKIRNTPLFKHPHYTIAETSSEVGNSNGETSTSSNSYSDYLLMQHQHHGEHLSISSGNKKSH